MKKIVVLDWAKVVATTALLTLTSISASGESFPPPAQSEAELRSFYATHMNNVVERQILTANHPVKRVGQRVSILMELITKRYGRNLAVKLSSIYYSASRNTFAASGFVDGVPTLYIVVPAYRDIYENLQKKRVERLQAVFENTLSIGLIHELEHLAYGLVPQAGTTREQFDDLEVQTWAHTCEETIRIFFEMALPLREPEQLFYRAWVSGGRTMLSAKWRDFVRQVYAQTR